MRGKISLLALLFPTCSILAADQPADKVLFDFATPAELKAWSNLDLPDAKVKEPPAKLDLSTDHAATGKQSLKITFAGGSWPALTTTSVPDNWMPWQTFKADVTVSRSCLIGFRVMQEKSKRGQATEEDLYSCWTKTALLKPGKNLVTGLLRDPYNHSIDAKRGKVVRLEIFMYHPHDGESIYVESIGLTSKKEENRPSKVRFSVAGTDWEVFGVNPFGVSSAEASMALGKKLKDRWAKLEAKTVEQIEDEFRAQYVELKKKHPRALLAVLRDGEKGYDPAQSNKVYAGWKDAYFTSHGPDGNYVQRAANQGKSPTHEIFMRHRSPLMRVDLACIPKGAEILAARLIVVRALKLEGRPPEKEPTMWVVEPCNRPWEEYEVNAFEYAKDKFWKKVGGNHWGDDPDFLPTFLAYGPCQEKVNSWDFTEAVRFWTSGKHPNHGFMLHGDSRDYMIGHARETKELKDRPAVLVIYDPK